MSGWARRAISSVATGTTSLTITKPTGTVDDDIMVMFLSHKGAGFATVPAGWTLIEQDVSGTIRGEMYWKRAATEGANYSVTGLADVAIGGIISYVGGLLSGNVVHLSAKRVNAIGADGVGAATPTEDNTLWLLMQANGDDEQLTTPSIDFPTDFSQFPVNYANPTLRINTTSTTGTDAALQVADNVMSLPMPTISGYSWSGTTTAENVGIVAYLKMEPATAFVQKYYLTNRPPGTYLTGELDGIWIGDSGGPGGYGTIFDTALLSGDKSAGGSIASLTLTCNETEGGNLFGRFITPKLAAQTLTSYTATLCNRVSAFFQTGSGTTNDCDVVFKIHAYLTNGDTLDLKTLLVDNEVDSVHWTSTATFRTFTVNFPASVSVASGDRIVFEIGWYIVTAPVPTPIYPPEDWTQVVMNRGTTATSAIMSLALLDSIAGDTVSTVVPWLEFSGTIEELSDVPTAPANDACADAEVIASVPFQSGRVDTRGSLWPNRAIWYKWVADRTQRMIVNILGSNSATNILIFTNEFTGACGAFLSGDQDGTYNKVSEYTHIDGGLTSGYFDAVSGRTYWFVLNNQGQATVPPNGGGSVQFELCPWETFAHGDIFYPCKGRIAVYREGQLVGLSHDFASSVLSGVAIDSTGNEIVDAFNNPGQILTADRLLVQVFGSNLLIEILDLQSLNAGESEIDFITAPLSGTNGSTLDINTDGFLFIGAFGNGFQLVANQSESFQNVVSTIATCQINKILATHGDNQPSAPWVAADLFTVDLESGGTGYIRLKTDSIVVYSSSGQYVPTAGTQILAYNTGTPAQIADVVNPLTAGSGPNPGPKGICPLSDGGILVCNGSVVQRYSSVGALTQTYTPSPAAYTLADVDLSNDGDSIWVMDSNQSMFYKFNLATGVQEDSFQTYLGRGSSTSFIVYAGGGAASNPKSGIYKVTPNKRSDTLWNDDLSGTEDVKIPDPFFKTGYIGS